MYLLSSPWKLRPWRQCRGLQSTSFKHTPRTAKQTHTQTCRSGLRHEQEQHTNISATSQEKKLPSGNIVIFVQGHLDEDDDDYEDD